MEKTMICIACPLGCHLKVSMDKEHNIQVSGNQCAKGKIYGEEELLSPKRVVTATVKTTSRKLPRVPVKTDGPLPKKYIASLLTTIYQLEITPPIKSGDKILKDITGSGINLLATRSLGE